MYAQTQRLYLTLCLADINTMLTLNIDFQSMFQNPGLHTITKGNLAQTQACI
jgi:hypothetical protein